MDKRAALLEQLRIDRSPSHTTGVTGTRWKWVIGVGAALTLTIAAGILVHAGRRAETPAHPTVARDVPLPPSSDPSAVRSLLDASGYVVALREATVSAKAIYKVNEVLVQEGQPVKAGQLIARLDDTNASAALQQSKAQVTQLEISLAAAKLAAEDAAPIYHRNQTQLSEGLISAETYDTSKSVYDSAQTAALIAEGALAVAKATLAINQRFEDDTIIKAPFDGVVTVKNAQPGEIVSPQFVGGGGIVKIVDMDSLEVDVDVSENFINRVHPKQPATITMNAYPGRPILAEVIAVIPTADRAKATVKVRIGFKEKDPRIVPEMGARVSFLEDLPPPNAQTAPSAPAVRIPVDAVQKSGGTGAGSL